MTVTEESRAYQRQDGLWVFPADEFDQTRFDYKAGQHVVFAGPTQRAGKTTRAFRLMRYIVTPDLPAYVAVCKPRDKVTSQYGAELGFRRTPTWPVQPKIKEMWEGKPPGYLVWPDMSDPNTALDNAARATENLIDDVYSRGAKHKKGILVLDDTVTKSKVLGLDRKMVMVITMSGAMEIGGWFFVQKPSDAGKAALWSYPNAEHVFISKDPVKKNRAYYDDIGGFEGGRVGRISLSLEPYQFLYLERTHGYMCIVDSK